MAITASKTQQQYYDDYYGIGKKKLDEQHASQKEADAQLVSQINAAIDKSAATTNQKYEDSIQNAPSVFQGQYDANEVQQLVEKKKLQEGMANMGLTDSGLSRNQNTALSVARQNADAGVRKTQNEYVTQLRTAMDDVIAAAETQKAEKQMAIEQNTDAWYRNALASMDTSAQKAAATAYGADVQANADYEKALLEKQQKDEELQQEWNRALLEAAANGVTVNADGTITKTSISGDDNAEMRYKYAKELMGNGASEQDAWAIASARYPDAGNANQQYYSYVTQLMESGYTGEQARKLIGYLSTNGGDMQAAQKSLKIDTAAAAVDNGKVDTSKIGTVWRSRADEVSTIMKQAQSRVNENAATSGLDTYEKQYATAIVAGRIIQNTYTSAEDKIDVLSKIYKNNSIADEYIKTMCMEANVDYTNVIKKTSSKNVGAQNLNWSTINFVK